jgi:hypothetical protein
MKKLTFLFRFILFLFYKNEQYADSFRIEYRRDNKQKWIKYKDFSGHYVRKLSLTIRFFSSS